jgi:hypothetical protein
MTFTVTELDRREAGVPQDREFAETQAGFLSIFIGRYREGEINEAI